jgi:anaerobic selenocysteine-containing dehydrogenase
MADVRPTICRFCPAHCGVLATIEDGRVVKVSGDPENPLFEGYTCVKGRALPDQHSNPARLLHSLSRGSDGELQPTPSARVIDEISSKLTRIIEQHGPRSVALYVGTNALPYAVSPGLAHAWLRGIGSRMFFTSNTIDQPGKQLATALHGRWLAGDQAFETADTALLVGLNPVISKSTGVPFYNPAMRLKKAKARGLKLIVVDPRKTETARFAHIHLQPRPGEDPTILAGMLHVILQEGLHDTEFVEANAQGFEQLAEQVAAFTPDYVARRADIRADDLIEAARVFAKAKRGMASCGTGPSMSTHGTLTEYLSRCLNTVCGRWPREGEVVLKPNVLMPAYDAKAQPQPPYQAWGYGEKLRVKGFTEAACGLPTAALADEILLEGDGQVRALICLGGNPMMAWPDQHKAHEAMKALDLLVTVDVEMSATAKLADYVVATKMTLETAGTTGPVEQLKFFGPGLGYSRPYAQYSPALVEPPAGSDLIEDWELFYGMAQNMKVDLYQVGFYGWGRHVESDVTVTPVDMVNKPSSEELLAGLTEGSRVPLDEVKKHPHGAVFDDESIVVLPRDADCDVRLELGDATMMEDLEGVRAEDYAPAHSDEEFSFRLIPRRADRFFNSSGRLTPRHTRRRAFNPAFMHPGDLERLDLVDGDVITIRSAHSSIQGVVQAEEGLRPGLISMTHAFGGLPDENDSVLEQGGNTGRLISVDVDYDPISGIPRMGAIPVAVTAS